MKYERWAPLELKPHVPYIISEPEVSYRKLNNVEDICILIATDGLFEIASDQQLVHWVDAYLSKKLLNDHDSRDGRNNRQKPTRQSNISLSQDIVEKSLNLVASSQYMSGEVIVFLI